MITRYNIKGFTLLEVLVALAILAVALSALIKTASENAENARYLRDKTLAHWVAMNVMTDTQIRNVWLPVGKNAGNMLMADRQWYWMLLISDTADKELRRMEVQVRDQEKAKEPIAIVVGFLGMP